MRHRQRFAATTLGLALGVGLLAAAPAQADTADAASAVAKSSPVKPANSCFTTPDRGPSAADATGDAALRGVVWWTPDYYDGEKLRVTDSASNGRRYLALFSWCESGRYVTYQRRDSGPDEGRTDHELYLYNFAEGRKVKFKACEERSSSDPTPAHCGPITYATA